MKARHGPFAAPGERYRWAANAMPVMFLNLSGEITAKVNEFPLGMVVNGGRIVDVAMSIERSASLGAGGACSISGEVFINGVSCLTTKCTITATSGEVAQHKTTAVTGDTGIVQSVLDSDNVDVSIGDIISATITVNRTSTIDAEAKRLCVAVMFQPD